MILSDSVNIKISNNQIKYYKSKGYDVKGGNEIKLIKLSDLPNNSGVKINVKCDVCDTEKYISLNRYMINTKNLTTYYACSRKCSKKKNIDTILNKYGVDNISKFNDIKSKKVETCLQNYGVEYPQQNINIFNKGKKTKLEKYGDENYNNNDKFKKTNLERYGVEYSSQNKLIMNKIVDKIISTNRDKILNKYDKIISYDGYKYVFECDCGLEHNYEITYKLLWQRKKYKTIMCTVCNPISKNNSGMEIQLLNFIKENYNGIVLENDRTVVSELDVYLPDLKLAFEFNGLWWHNELYKEKKYHLNKTEECERNDIQLIYIWEDDWNNKRSVIESMILNKLSKSEKIYARKCILKEVDDNKLVKQFLDKSHIQGYVGSKIKIGLFYNDELVSLMTLGNRRVAMGKKTTNKGEFELLRYCNKPNTNVVGGASKLFNYFLEKYKPEEVTTYADRSFSQGHLYKTLGFNFIHKTDPNYYYIIDGIRKHRFNFRKDVLIKQGFDGSKTEHQIMLDRKIYRIFDSGNLKFIYKNKNNI